MDRSAQGSQNRLYRILFHASWMVLALVALWQRLSLPLEPAADNDIWGFLNPGLQQLIGHGFQHTNNRNFLYPSFIGLLLRIFRDFRAITIAQHLMGVATGVLLMASWTQVRRCFRQPRLPHWLFDLAGLLTMVVYLFATEPEHFEYFIRPDVACPFFAALALYCVVRFLNAKYTEPDSKRAILFGALIVFLAMFIPNLKPSYWLTSAFFTIPVWVSLFDRKEPLLRRALMVAIPALTAYLLIWLPEKRFAVVDPSSETFLPESIFSIHAVIIRDQMADDVAHPDPAVPYSHEKLATTLSELDQGIAAAREQSPRHFESLGYDADFLLYHQPFFDQVAQAEHYDWKSILGFYRYYYNRTWKKRPGAMLHKVGKQLGLFYNFDCPAYCDKKFDLRRTYERSLFVLSDPGIQNELRQWPPAVHWQEQQAALRNANGFIDMNKMLRRFINWLGNSYLIGLIGFLLALPWVTFHRRWRRAFGVAAAALVVGYAFNFGNNLGIAVMHTLEVSRYTYVQFCTTVWTEMLTFVFLIELGIDLIASFRHKTEAPVVTNDSEPPLILEESV